MSDNIPRNHHPVVNPTTIFQLTNEEVDAVRHVVPAPSGSSTPVLTNPISELVLNSPTANGKQGTKRGIGRQGDEPNKSARTETPKILTIDVKITCTNRGLNILLKRPKKNWAACVMFMNNMSEEFRELIFHSAGIDPTITENKSVVHQMLENFYELSKPCPAGTTNEFYLYTRVFLVIPNEFYESLDDKQKLEEFCNGTQHLICAACVGSSGNKPFNLRNNQNAYVSCAGKVNSHPHDHTKGMNKVALAMIKAGLVKLQLE